MGLQGRAAVVTGGSGGIGAAVADALARAGARVIVAARGGAALRRAATLLARGGGEVLARPCDVSRPGEVKALARDAARRLGGCDILVNAAGIAPSAPFIRTSREDWDRALTVNATGPFLCMQAFLPGMLRRGWGRIVNVASTAGRVGAPYIAAYAASKHALLGLTRSVAAEVAAKGVTVNAVCPGYVDTEMTRRTVDRIVERTGRTRAQALQAILETTPQRRLIPAAEVAALVLSLCADEARGINGQAIVLDGGGVQG